MRGRRALKQVFNRLRGRGDGTFVEGLDGGFRLATQRALLYYKTEPLVHPEVLEDYAHTNSWEITEIVRILNGFGFTVDVVDRTAEDFMPEDKYDLFIGLGAGRSGRHFARYAAAVPGAIKVLLAAGPDPVLSNRLIQEHYDRFNARHGTRVPAMRLADGVDFPEFVKHTDYFLCIGEGDQFGASSYQHLGRPVLSYLPAVSPKVRFARTMLDTRRRDAFLCFAGNGLICKGVDVVVEAFLEMPELELHFCGPDTEPGFFEVLGDRIRKAGNIRYEGFIKVGGSRFEQLLRECSFVVAASSKDACATSVVTVMRGGLVPVLTREVGVNVEKCGFRLEAERKSLIAEIKDVCRRVSTLPDDRYRGLVFETLRESLKYTQASFTQTFSAAILEILRDRLAQPAPVAR